MRHPHWLIRGGVSALSNHSLRGLKKATHRFKCWIQVCQIERHIITMPESEICSYFDQPWWHREMTLYHGKIILNWTIVRPTLLTEQAKETDPSYRMHRLNVRRNPAILCVYWFHAHLIHCYVYVINAKRRRRLCALRQENAPWRLPCCLEAMTRLRCMSRFDWLIQYWGRVRWIHE